MNTEKRFYVYTYSYPNGVPFYVGKGTGKRIKNHLWDAKANRKLNSFTVRVIKKLLREDKEPIVEKIIDNIDEEFAFLIEEEFIRKYGRRNTNTGILTNNTDGGEGTSNAKGIKRTPEQIEKMRIALTGHKQSEETKRKRSLKAKGYVHKKVQCPKCGTIGGETGMKRHHFDNCTGAKTFRARVHVDGKRYHVGYFATLEEVEIAKKNFVKNKKGL